MLYIVVDPKFLYLPHEVSQQEAEAFLLRLLAWSNEYAQYNIEFGITRTCHDALMNVAHASFTRKNLEQLVTKYWYQLNVDDIVKAIMPFLNRILHESYIDNLIEEHLPKDMTWELSPENTMISPREYVDRFNDDFLAYSYKHMMAHVTFARSNRIVPLADFRDLRILSTFNEQESDWSKALDYQLIVQAPVIWLLGNHMEETDIQEVYIAIESPKQIAEFINKKQKYRRVIDAVDSAVDEFPRRLILSRLGKQTAEESDYESPEKIHELVRGLVTVWLPAYLRGGDELAGKEYYSRYKYQYAQDESKTVQRTPTLRKEYEVEHKGDLVFCGKHIKIGTGPRSARINFEVVQHNDQDCIILGRVGKHGPNARRPK